MSMRIFQEKDKGAHHFEHLEDGMPVVLPLKTSKAVKEWTRGVDEFCKGTVPLRSRQLTEKPRLLVCHDFKGGYQDDRYIQGSSDLDAYRFFNWHLIDEFIYFSHYFVTIPPPGWTNAAHLHGVPIYGTIITEWEDGKARCEEFLSTKESYEMFVNQLVAIAEYYQFDGWLINIENVIKNDLLENLLGFVGTLTEKMHAKLPHSKVIWYDSVIDTGELKWQNEINDHNSRYFAACDGLFVNYTWKDEHLENSVKVGKELGRLHDLYFGIDVYGRGCRGDGGFNTKEALEAVSQHGLSAAIFAFGWVHEKLGPENFTVNEVKFWSLLQSWCTVHPYSELPVSLHFCHGNGRQLKSSGKTLMDEPWSSVSLQSMQPHLLSPQVKNDKLISAGDFNVEWSYNDAFSGGSSLKLVGNSGSKSKYFSLCSLAVNVESDELIAGLVMKLNPEIAAALEIKVTDEAGMKKTFLLDGTQSETIQTLNKAEVARLLEKFEIIQHPSDWSVSVSKVSCTQSMKLEELGLQTTSKESQTIDSVINLGQVFLFSKKSLELPLVTGLTFLPSEEQEKGRLCGLLTWSCPQSTVLHYKIFQEQPESNSWSFIGHSHCARFQVDIKDIQTQQVRLKVQPFVNIGFPVNLETCLALDINVPS